MVPAAQAARAEVSVLRRGRPAAGLVLALLSGGLVACSGARPAGPPGVEQAVLAFVATSQADGGGDYRAPQEEPRRDLPQALLHLAAEREPEAAPLLARHGYRVEQARGSRLVVPERVPDGRGWGLYAVRPGGAALAVEVPHPRADRLTEHLGAALAERTGAQHLLVAGARRDRDDGAADVAHEPDSLFAAVHAALAAEGLPAVQVHGFAASSSPGQDVVVSPGSAALTPLVQRLADAAEASGLRTCRAWQQDCGPLEGRTNVQSRASARAGAPFVHLEVTAAVREDAGRRAALVEALAAALLPPAPG